jgi:site-specific DNA recombinase
MQKVAGYIRVSSKGQEKGFGKDLQLKAIVDLCKSKGFFLDCVFQDSAISGTEKGLEDREGFYQLIDECTKKEIKIVVIYDLSRIWRDDYVRLILKRLLLKNGINIISCNQPQYSLENEEDPAMYLISNLLESLASFERLQIISRLKAGRRAKLAAGKFSGGGVGLGYRAENKDLIVDETEMKLVRKILRMKKKGFSTYAIAKELRNLGYRGKLGGRIEPSTIRNVIKSKLYKGFLKYGGAFYKAPRYKIKT